MGRAKRATTNKERGRVPLPRSRERSSRALPRYTDRAGWTGGDNRTLYAFIDQHTGKTVVRPIYNARGIGPMAAVRLATRAEAEEQWQSPLHPGWRVA